MFSQRIINISFQAILTIAIFSIWAGFALLVINPYFHERLPGYTIGRICIWEFVALAISWFLAHVLIRRWGDIEMAEMAGQRKLIINQKFGYLFMIYFLVAIAIAVWQFWIFSMKF